MSGDDVQFWKTAANWLWLLLVPAVMALWSALNGRIRRIEYDVSRKSSEADMARMWEAHKDMALALTHQDNENRKRFETLQVGMGRIEGKLDAIINRPRAHSGSPNE